MNQYAQVTTPAYENILGVALATNSVTVNSSTADRKVEYFQREITVANGSGPLWQSVTVSSGSSSTNGGFVFPAGTQTLTYDSDGNLTFDGVWAYRWDGENRLVEMTMTNIASVPNPQRKRLQFAYDYQGRRVSKAVSTWTGSAFGSPVTTRFVYDLPAGQAGGWNLLAELDASANVLRSYAWGQDLNGSMDQAGGIGGLLTVAEHGTGGALTNHFVGYDGNGNLTGVIRSDGTLSARYEYNPFGEATRVSGPLAKANPFRWSTKFTDEESGVVYYGHRYYNPSIGRWIRRDPTAEEGGLNLYTFVNNSALNYLDPDGLSIFDWIRNSPNASRAILAAALLAVAGKEKPSRAAAVWLERKQQVENSARLLRESNSRRGIKGAASALAFSLGLTALEAMASSLDAAMNVMAGISSEPGTPEAHLESMFRNIRDGDPGADLDRAVAALEMTDGAASAAIVAWGVFAGAGEGFSDFLALSSN